MSTGMETERKFIVKIPDFSLLEQQIGYTVSHIHQTYLTSESGVTRRVRMREYADRTEYYETRKTRVSALSAIEEENLLSRERYLTLLGEQAEGTRTLQKTRHTIPHGDLVWEFDVYPEWHGTCIMEVELPCEEYDLSLPSFVCVVEEVTGRREYTNAAMSRIFPAEIDL